MQEKGKLIQRTVAVFEAKSKRGAIFCKRNYDGDVSSKLLKSFDFRPRIAMNAVEIEAAISDLAGQPFDKAEFPYPFLS